METERSQVKLDQILAAAKKRFGRYGLSKTTMNNIADDIGLSKASLYYYYKDKETLFTAVIEKEQEHFLKEMQEIVHTTTKADGMLLAYIDLRIDLFKKLITPGKFSYDSYLEIKPFFSSMLQNFRKKEMKMIMNILKIGVERKVFSVDNIKEHTEFFLDTLRGLRQVIIAEYAVNEMLDIPPKKYQKLKQHSILFVEYFIKGISA